MKLEQHISKVHFCNIKDLVFLYKRSNFKLFSFFRWEQFSSKEKWEKGLDLCRLLHFCRWKSLIKTLNMKFGIRILYSKLNNILCENNLFCFLCVLYQNIATAFLYIRWNYYALYVYALCMSDSLKCFFNKLL